ncbi:MAG: DedA family protein [Methylohalobius sp.]|nr:DedA family protein [Methylohalobius sp.]
MFDWVYRKALHYARHRHAVWYLGAVSFAEAVFFPLPPDAILVPMSLAQPKKAWRLAGLTTLASVGGGMFGYGIGYFFFSLADPWLHKWHYWEAYLTAKQWFYEFGFWAVLVAGFSPIPYKVFTIAAGSLSMNPVPFLLASVLGRGGRFFLVAGLIALGGERLEQAIYRNINRIGWASAGIAGLALVGYWLMRSSAAT